MTVQDNDFTGMLAVINVLIRAEKIESYEPFTVNDLNYIEVNINSKCSLSHLFDGSHNFAIDIMINPYVIVEAEVNDKDLSLSLSTSRDLTIPPFVTLGYVDYNYSLAIK